METIRSVLVTGASSGFGPATAQLLNRSGMQVFAGSIEPRPGAIVLQIFSALKMVEGVPTSSQQSGADA